MLPHEAGKVSHLPPILLDGMASDADGATMTSSSIRPFLSRERLGWEAQADVGVPA